MTISLHGKPLPTAPDYPFSNAGWYMLHPGRMSNYGVQSVINAVILHTPEEPADDYESTPVFFWQDPNTNGSVGGTQYYLSNNGDWIQMARDYQQVHAQGVASANARLPRPIWFDPSLISYNTQCLSVEIEGYAATLHQTMPVGGVQWKSLVKWIAYKCKQYNIPVTRQYIMGHWELAKDRTDPGAQFPWGDLMVDVKNLVNGPESSQKIHVVAAGDTLGAIAESFGTTLDAIVATNNITNPNAIYVGQRIVIPGTETKPPLEEKPSPATPHRRLTTDELAGAITISQGFSTGPVNGIRDAKFEPTSEVSGQYEVHRLLVRRQ